MRLKLGILQVNHDKSPIGDAFPDDAHRFRDLFDAQDQRFAYRVYMTIGGEVPGYVGEQDAFLITGSPLSVLDELPFLPDLYDFIRGFRLMRTASKRPAMRPASRCWALASAIRPLPWHLAGRSRASSGTSGLRACRSLKHAHGWNPHQMRCTSTNSTTTR